MLNRGQEFKSPLGHRPCLHLCRSRAYFACRRVIRDTRVILRGRIQAPNRVRPASVNSTDGATVRRPLEHRAIPRADSVDRRNKDRARVAMGERQTALGRGAPAYRRVRRVGPRCGWLPISRRCRLAPSVLRTLHPESGKPGARHIPDPGERHRGTGPLPRPWRDSTRRAPYRPLNFDHEHR